MYACASMDHHLNGRAEDCKGNECNHATSLGVSSPRMSCFTSRTENKLLCCWTPLTYTQKMKFVTFGVRSEVFDFTVNVREQTFDQIHGRQILEAVRHDDSDEIWIGKD
ncbi:hypothetical protein AVEN_22646-1 [Araneus ventricosus]|uniref:Uncharacterized protein n=1 Tax=Araneus ventricosus TaxID=182803 RepID=A0A4Y2JWS3_ARAVE|nr:hypothetical protein AVEN_22646-1 [Araneus ventricosus]